MGTATSLLARYQKEKTPAEEMARVGDALQNPTDAERSGDTTRPLAFEGETKQD